MSSEVEICNLALAHLGDSATVASIDPPEGSAQAEHCARWYPIARDSLLELYEWNFATTRALLAELVNTSAQWQHAYARPSDCLKILAVFPADASGDGAAVFPQSGYYRDGGNRFSTVYNLQDFTTEAGAGGSQLILTNVGNAAVRYTRQVTDTGKFSPLFRDALGWYLASYLAGPVLKAETGISVGQAMMKVALGLADRGAMSSADQQGRQQMQAYPWSR